MPPGIAKGNLPTKMCLVCERPFTWRKVWERCWDEVNTCSDRCKAERKKTKNAENRQVRSGAAAPTQAQGLIVMPDQEHQHLHDSTSADPFDGASSRDGAKKKTGQKRK
mmetsp:Transcript_7001/g.11904  ORF Transcript_7001/g.11904 Transcript_7001/m.11904 type:complete len:109 (-) Transcript_7001:720-1046(-)